MVANIYDHWRDNMLMPDLVLDPLACYECFKYYSNNCFSCKQREYLEAKYFINKIKIFLNARLGLPHHNKYLILEIVETQMHNWHFTLYELFKMI